jgi:ATP-dependent Clp protease ATP-binding subunit ClpB
MVNPNNWTDKTTEIFTSAQSLAVDNQNAQLSPIHLMCAFFDDPASIACSAAQKLNFDVKNIERIFKKHLARLPTQSPPPDSPSLNQNSLEALKRADELKTNNNDSLLDVDYIFQALLEV